MSLVWDLPVDSPTKKLTLLALADWCNDDGGSLYPSLQAVADRVGVSRDQARRHVRALVCDGLLDVVDGAQGGRPGATPRYQLHVSRIRDRVALIHTGGTDATRIQGETGGMGAMGGVAPMQQTGGMGATRRVAPMPPEPSLNHQGSRTPPAVDNSAISCRGAIAESRIEEKDDEASDQPAAQLTMQRRRLAEVRAQVAGLSDRWRTP